MVNNSFYEKDATIISTYYDLFRYTVNITKYTIDIL